MIHRVITVLLSIFVFPTQLHATEIGPDCSIILDKTAIIFQGKVTSIKPSGKPSHMGKVLMPQTVINYEILTHYKGTTSKTIDVQYFKGLPNNRPAKIGDITWVYANKNENSGKNIAEFCSTNQSPDRISNKQ